MKVHWREGNSAGSITIATVNDNSCKGTYTVYGSEALSLLSPAVGTVLTFPEDAKVIEQPPTLLK